MKHYALPIILVVLSSVSCDRAKDLLGKARNAVSSEIAKQGNAGATTPDPELQKLVDQTPEGTIFRKDLPFPSQLEVRTTRIEQMSVRSSESSEIEKSSKQVNGTQTEVSRLERNGNQLRYTEIESMFIDANAGEDEKAKIRENSKEAKPLMFVKSGSTWKSSGTDFLSASVIKTLAPVFDEVLVEHALAPRPLWFGKRRFKVGDQLTVTGDTLPMLVAGKATGNYVLTLESFEAVYGHPCGVFRVTGDFNRKRFPGFDGVPVDHDVTIQSGKLWLSLIYPLVLREETDTIQTVASGGKGNLAVHLRGGIKVSVVREWKKKGS